MGMRTDLKSHIHNVHRAKEVCRHLCVECGKGFPHKYSLKKHMMIHTDERPIECPVCHMRFRTNSNYNKHAKTHFKKTLPNISKSSAIRIIPDVELSVHQLGGDSVQLDLSNVPVLTPLTVQTLQMGQTGVNMGQTDARQMMNQHQMQIPTNGFIV